MTQMTQMTKSSRDFGLPEPVSGTFLTKREAEILDLLVTGLCTREIADELALRRNTVRSHLRNIYEKLNCRTRTQVVITAFRMGLATCRP
jgi:DNA-binding NarL/FixJ family response regulator